MSSMDNPFRLDGETALITGGGTGLGLGMARCMGRSGVKAGLVGRRDGDLRQAVGELGANATFVSHDVTQLDRAGELIKHAEDASTSKISILINNAGVHLKKPAVQTSHAEFNAVLQT